MKKRWKTIVATMIVLSYSFFSGVVLAEADVHHVNWLSYDGHIFARSSNIDTPVLLYVTAGWCKFCKEMSQTTLNDPAVVSYINRNFLPIMLDADEDASIVRQYNITALPAIVVLSSKNHIVKEFAGYRTSEEAMKLLIQAYRAYQI